MSKTRSQGASQDYDCKTTKVQDHQSEIKQPQEQEQQEYQILYDKNHKTRAAPLKNKTRPL